MDLKEYKIRVEIGQMLYKDYKIKAENIFFAKILAMQECLKDFPDIDVKDIKMSLAEPTSENIKEIINIIGEEK